MRHSSERAFAHAWAKWESWCDDRGLSPVGHQVPLEEYLRWLVDPMGGGLSASSARSAYWAVRRTLRRQWWRDVTYYVNLADVLGEEERRAPRRRARPTRADIERATACLGSSPREVRDAVVLWVSHEGRLRPGQLVALRWRHVTWDEDGAVVTVIHPRPRLTRRFRLWEDEEPIAALRALYALRRRRADEPVVSSIPWTNDRVSSNPLSVIDIRRITAQRIGQAPPTHSPEFESPAASARPAATAASYSSRLMDS